VCGLIPLHSFEDLTQSRNKVK